MSDVEGEFSILADSVSQRLRALPLDTAVLNAAVAVERACSNPFRTIDGQLVRCGSRYAAVCPSCSRLAVGDWSAIFRSGVFDTAPGLFQFLFVTLTAPGFGRVHHVPVEGQWRRCACGSHHRPHDEHLRGVPVDFERYDYYSAVAWNRDVGLLWANTRRALIDLLPGMEYAKVHEMQARLALHVHAIIRVPATVRIDTQAISSVIGNVSAASNIDGLVWSWGSHGVDVKMLTERLMSERGNVFARATGYMAKMISYVTKSVSVLSGRQRLHESRMHAAARAMPCDRCPPVNVFGLRPRCRALLHARMGARQVVVTTSRKSARSTGWSMTGLNRTVLRAVRQQYMANKSREGYEAAMLTAAASRAFLNVTISLAGAEPVLGTRFAEPPSPEPLPSPSDEAT